MNNRILVFFLGFIILSVGVYLTVNTKNVKTLNMTSQDAATSPTLTSGEQNQPQTRCSEIITPSQTEGPYYKAGSPQRNNIAQDIAGDLPAGRQEKLIVSGYVFDKECKPIANAWLDFWQADASGVYDNVGYKLRGNQYTDQNGKYQLTTIVPSAYQSRPPHIHVKLKSPNGTILTSQMYFPNEDKNQNDSIFNPALIMKVKDGTDGKTAEFNFVLNF